MNIENVWHSWSEADCFSGVFFASDAHGMRFIKCGGFRNWGEKLLNNLDTAFGIASGTKLFTGLAVCKLVESKKLSLNSKLWDILSYDLGQINKSITVFHLLTHSSGIGDYIDEETDDSSLQLRELYRKYPVYLWERLGYYLPMITPLQSKFQPGARFGYSNAGYALLGLVVEAVSGMPYQQYVEETIIKPCNLVHTGFYRMDALPENTALGYIKDEKSHTWRSNIFSMPIVGGADGGLFTCAHDLEKVWHALLSHRILSEEMLSTFLAAQIKRSEDKSYGLGIYRYARGNSLAYYAVGGDFGVAFFTAYFPKQKMVVSALGNTEINTASLLLKILSAMDE